MIIIVMGIIIGLLYFYMYHQVKTTENLLDDASLRQKPFSTEVVYQAPPENKKKEEPKAGVMPHVEVGNDSIGELPKEMEVFAGD